MPRMGTLILLSAIPGSGKSTWSKAYQREHPNTYIVSSDDVRQRVSGGLQNFDKEPLVWETFLADLQAHQGEDCTVIADATNLQNRYRTYYYENTPGYDKHILVVFDVPFDVCMAQNKMRVAERIVSDEAMHSLQDEFEDPSDEVLAMYDEYLIVDRHLNARKVK